MTFRMPPFIGNQDFVPILGVSETGTMFDKVALGEIMDAIWDNGNGKVPTNQLVREAMRNADLKGTNDVVAAAIRSWKADHGLAGSVARTRIPSKASSCLDGTAPGATLAVLVERTSAAMAKLAEVEERLRVLETDDLLLLERARAARRRQIEEFWGRVTDAISEILNMHHSMTLHDVAEMFPEALCREAEGLGHKLNFDTLKERMSRSTPHELHEVEADDHSYEG